MNYDEFFNYQISDTNPLDFADWLKSEFLRSCPRELEIENKKLELFGGIATPDEDNPSHHFYLVGLPRYGKPRAGKNKNNGEAQWPLGIKDFLVVAPDLFSRSMVDFEIQASGENSIRVICTCKMKYDGLVEIIKNLREQIRLNYNPVIVYDPTWLDVVFNGFLLRVESDVLFEFTIENSPEIFLEWCHTELAVTYPGSFIRDIDIYDPEENHLNDGDELYYYFRQDTIAIITSASGIIVPPDKNESAWRYFIIGNNRREDGKLFQPYVIAYIAVRPIGYNQCFVQCLSVEGINPEMRVWLARLEESAKTINTSTLMAEEGEKAPSDKPEPWMCIPDHFWDRKAVEMWCNGHSNKEIARKVNVVPRSVTNRISFLRRMYPDAHIPTHEERRKTHDTT